MSVPVTVAAALAVTQWLARGMTSPLREMTDAARGMAGGDYAQRVTAILLGRGGHAGPRVQRDGRRPGERRPAAPPARGHGLARAAHPADRPARPAREPRRRRRAPRRRRPARRAHPGRAAQRPRRRPARPVPDRRRGGAAAPHRGDGRATCCATGSPRPLVGGRPVRVVARDAPGRPHRRRPTRPGSPSSSPTSSTTRCGTARPGRGAGRRPRRRTRTPGGSRSATTAPASRPTASERVFDRFGSGGDSAGGTGLGLAIASWVCELHGGIDHRAAHHPRNHRRAPARRPAPARPRRPAHPPASGERRDRTDDPHEPGPPPTPPTPAPRPSPVRGDRHRSRRPGGARDPAARRWRGSARRPLAREGRARSSR